MATNPPEEIDDEIAELDRRAKRAFASELERRAKAFSEDDRAFEQVQKRLGGFETILMQCAGAIHDLDRRASTLEARETHVAHEIFATESLERLRAVEVRLEASLQFEAEVRKRGGLEALLAASDQARIVSDELRQTRIIQDAAIVRLKNDFERLRTDMRRRFHIPSAASLRLNVKGRLRAAAYRFARLLDSDDE